MTYRALCAVLPLAFLVTACEASKSSNPLSPSVAAPIPGVEISAPKILEPASGTKIADDKQPVTLLIENAWSTGARPLTLRVEIATDAAFSNPVFSRDGLTPGDGGRTTVRLPDPLASGRTYFWRARAQDGANTGPYSGAADFSVYTPIVIEAPSLISPAANSTVTGLRPKFVFANAPHSGPVGPISYWMELADSDAFTNKVGAATSEQPSQTTYDMPTDLAYSKVYYWHVRAYDPTTTGPWSATQAFRTPEAPPVSSPGPTTPGPTSPGSGGSHVAPGPLTVDHASQVVYATAREFPRLTAVFGSQGEAESAAEELLRRTIWHLQQAGYQAARQRNPSGAISKDKLTIYINGAWHAYDIFSLGVAGRATQVQFVEVSPPGPVADAGIPD